MTKKYENIISRAYETVSAELKATVKEESSRYSSELTNSFGFGHIANFIFKALSPDQRGELMNCATENKLMTSEATNKRVFNLMKKICEVA